MSGSGKTNKPNKQRATSASASQSIHANDAEEVTATMLCEMLQSFKADICNSIDSAVKGLQADS